METTLKVRKVLAHIIPTWSTPVVLDGAAVVQAFKTAPMSLLAQFKTWWKSLWTPPVPLVSVAECENKLVKAQSSLKAKQEAHLAESRSVTITFDERDAA